MLVAADFGLDLSPRRIERPGLRHLLHHALLQDLGDRLVTAFQPGILANADHRRRTPLSRRLLIEQNMQPAEDDAAGIEEGDIVGHGKVLLAESELLLPDGDLQILRYRLIFLFAERRLQFLYQRLFFAAGRLLVGERGLRNQGIKLAQALFRADFGMMLHLHIENLLRVGIAHRDPGRLSRLRNCSSAQKSGHYREAYVSHHVLPPFLLDRRSNLACPWHALLRSVGETGFCHNAQDAALRPQKYYNFCSPIIVSLATNSTTTSSATLNTQLNGTNGGFSRADPQQPSPSAFPRSFVLDLRYRRS